MAWTGANGTHDLGEKIIRDHGLKREFYRLTFNELLANPDMGGCSVPF